MSWDRNPRRPDRLECRPSLETLETRQVLSGSNGLDALVGATQVQNLYGVSGQGLSAALIDTGVNYNHAAFGGGIGPGHKVIGGYDFADADADPMATWQHGTSVAGIIASSDPAHPGVAPGSNIVALRVFGNDNQGSYDRIEQALQWVLDNHDQYNITVVNISISDNNTYTLNWFEYDGGPGQRITQLVHQLRGLNIPVVAAAGNGFNGSQGMGFLAILPETISVTATDLSDKLAPDAERLGSAIGGPLATDIAAPGDGIEAPGDGNSYTTVDGTSFAAPVVSGAILLLQSIYEQRFHALPSVDQLESWLRGGATAISDPATGITLGRLDIAKSAALIPPGATSANPPVVIVPNPVVTPPVVTPPVVTPPVVTPPDRSTTGSPATPPVVNAPAPVVDDALALLYEDGRPAGTVASNSAANPFRDALGALGLQGTFHSIQTWGTVAAAKPYVAPSVTPATSAYSRSARASAAATTPTNAAPTVTNRAEAHRQARNAALAARATRAPGLFARLKGLVRGLPRR